MNLRWSEPSNIASSVYVRFWADTSFHVRFCIDFCIEQQKAFDVLKIYYDTILQHFESELKDYIQ